MMIQIKGRIPLTIYPTFWLFAALIGYWNSQSFVGTLVWIGIIFVSVLFHEFGHALTALTFKQNPRIELVALGGLTYHEGGGILPFWKQFLIVFNGPLFGFILVIVASLLLQIPSLAEGIIGVILSLTRVVNLFWTVVNLLPVMPLDGGQLMRIVFEKLFGAKGLRYAMIASLSIALLFSLFFFLMQQFLIGALFFLFAFQSYDLIRKTRHFSETDRSDDLREELAELEISLQTGQKQQAKALCEKILSRAKEGVIFETATQYLAFLKYEERDFKEVYKLLSSIKEELGAEAVCLLQKAAFEQKDFSLVRELAGTCFQTLPTVETALRNAYAHAQLKDVIPTLGWIQTARDEGLDNLKETLANPLFDPVRQDHSFQEFLHTL